MSGALRLRLRLIGRRLLATALTSGLFLGLSAMLLELALFVWLDLLWELSPRERILAIGVALTCTPALILAGGLWARRRLEPQSLARRLDRVAGTGGQVLSGVELAIAMPTGNAVTTGLAELAIEHAHRLALRVNKSAAVSLRPAYLSFGVLGTLTLLLAIAAVVMPRLAQTQWLRFLDPYGDHPPYSRILFEVWPGDTQIVYGRSLEVTVRTSGAVVERLELVFQTSDRDSEDILPLFPDTADEWRGTIAEVTSSGHYFIRAAAGRSRKYEVRVVTVPRIEQVRFRITLPAYTHRPPYDGPLPQGGLAGLPGTQVELWVTSNRPLASGNLELPGDARATLTPVADKPHEVKGAFIIKHVGRIKLSVTDVDGQDSTDTLVAPISLLEDGPPSVRILQPPAMSLAIADVELPVAVAAEDDYGIARVQLFRSLNQSTAYPLELEVNKPAPTQWTGSVSLPLARYGLKPGDEIRLFARVEDTDPAGPKGSESSVVLIRVIKQDDYERLARRRRGLQVLLSKYQQARRRMESLADEMEQRQQKLARAPKDELISKQHKQELQNLSRRFKREAESLRALSRNRLPYELDKELTKELDRLAEELDRLARESDALAAKSKLGNAEGARELARLQERMRLHQSQWDRQAMAPLEQLASLYPLLEDANRFIDLYQRQRSLADRSQSLQKLESTEDVGIRNRMRDFQSEQREIRNSLIKLLDDMEDHIAKLPREPEFDPFHQSVVEFIAKVRASGAIFAMSEAESGFSHFSGRRGHENALKAANILQSFVRQIEASDGILELGQRGLAARLQGLRFQPSILKSAGDTLRQLLGDSGWQGRGQSGQMPGSRTGRGYSTRRSSLENVGLFGNLPGAADLVGSGQSEAGAPGERAGNSSDRPEQTKALDGERQRKSSANTATESAVPPIYRKRVSEYFKRIVEEAEPD